MPLSRLFTSVLVMLFLLLGCISNQPQAPLGEQNTTSLAIVEQKTLTLITYDGFNSEYGLGRVILPKFEAECGCTVKVLADGDVGWMVAKVLNDPGDADVVLGIDNSYRSTVSEEGLFAPYKPKNYDTLHSDVSDGDYRFIAYDYGFLAIMYDNETTTDYPISLEDMTDARFKSSFVIPDPRSSSTGRDFAMWVGKEYGERTKDYFERLKPNILAITPGWTESYGLFTSGEAPYTLSYTTSPAYHIAFEETSRYHAIQFPSMYKQVEYVSILSSSKNPELAKEFVDFMLKPEVQSEIPLGNFMYPSVKDTPLPDAYATVNYPQHVLEEDDNPSWIAVWNEVFGQ